MGCDIHMITQIKVGNKWEYIPEIPTSLLNRNYHTFAVIAGVRDSFNSKLFEPKGLPSDLGGTKYGWDSDYEYIKETYETKTVDKYLLPSGEYISTYDSRLTRKCTKEEYDNWHGSKSSSLSKGEYYIDDPATLNGKLVNVKYKDIYTFEEYLKEYYQDEYDETVNDYGSWDVDFSIEDLHTPSYLTLKELKEKDYDSLNYEKCKVVKDVVEAFIRLGGKFPDGMTIEQSQPDDIVECLRYVFEPTVVLKWRKETDVTSQSSELLQGIDELESIARQYEIDDYNNIRIVFAFDN